MEKDDEKVVDAEYEDKGDILPRETTDLTKADTTAIMTQDEMTALVDNKIAETVRHIFDQIVEDRNRSTDVFNELNELFLMGETDPEVIAQLNKANENIQSTSDALVKTLDKLAKLKTGADRIQIANINAETKSESGNSIGNRAELVRILNETMPEDEE